MSTSLTAPSARPARERGAPASFPPHLPREAADRLARIAAAALRAPAGVVLLEPEGATVGSARALPVELGAGATPPSWLALPEGTPPCQPVLVRGARGRGAPPPRSFAAVSLPSPEGAPIAFLFALEAPGRELGGEDLGALADLADGAASEIALRHELEVRLGVERRLRHDTLHDSLTSLPNRTLFLERLGHAIARARRRKDYLFAVLFLDLDRFKVVNDSLGHHVGDELLVAVARRLERCLRAEDTVARLGGDEFAILLENIGDISDAGRIAERIQRELSSPVNLSGYEVFTSVSIGIVDSTAAHGAAERLLRSADMAMYRAKAAGKARYEMFDRAMHAQALSRLQLETDLRHGLERGEFRLLYQPIVSIVTGRIIAVEALLRWAQFERGLVSPTEFIPLAEEMGLIVPLGKWAIEQACAQARRWRDAVPEAAAVAMSVNLSVRQFSQPDLVRQVAEALAAAGLPPDALTLEITESMVVDNPDHASHVLRELKALGVSLHMDDFGTGYSSLSYLTRLPMDAIKIDRAFVSRMETDDTHFQLVRTILTLARSMNLRAVAEGVETEAQLLALRKLGCAEAQGYHFSRPCEPEAIEAMLREDPRW
jgi:diguanylate cyclase (GGDEF)-like protein